MLHYRVIYLSVTGYNAAELGIAAMVKSDRPVLDHIRGIWNSLYTLLKNLKTPHDRDIIRTGAYLSTMLSRFDVGVGKM